MQSNCFQHTFSNAPKTAEGPQLAVTVRGQDQTLTVATVSQMSPADFSSLWRVRAVHWICLYAPCDQCICWHCKCHIRCAVSEWHGFCCWRPAFAHRMEHGCIQIARQLPMRCLANANMVLELRGTCTHCQLAGNSHCQEIAFHTSLTFLDKPVKGVRCSPFQA